MEPMHYGRWGFAIQEGQDGSLEISLLDFQDSHKEARIPLTELQAKELAADLVVWFAAFTARLVREEVWAHTH